MTATLSKTVADFETTLASAVSIGDTSCTLVSATDDDGIALTSGTYALTVDLGNNTKLLQEFIYYNLCDVYIEACKLSSKKNF